jgi:sugar lactone lactonase YvrE
VISVSKSSKSLAQFYCFSALVLLCSVAANAAGTWTDNQNAVSVLGQAGFTQATAQAGASGMFQPSSVRFDPTSGKLFVADCANSRVLRFANTQALLTGSPAEAAFGQTDLNGVTGGFSQSKIRCSGEMAIDSAGHLWVADIDNNRVLRWDNAATIASGQPANAVLGQADFTTVAAGTTQSKMSLPEGLFLDGSGRLWVADTGNNRVLRFDSAAGKANGANADAVLGQSGFVSNSAAITQTTFSAPNSITGNSAGSIWVSDSANNRILRFDLAATKANGGNADSVIGSVSFTSITISGTTASSLDTPSGLAIDAAGRLYVADGNNDRVLIFNAAASLGAGAAATNVLGQSTYTDSTAHVTQSGFDMPYTPTWDEASQSLWLADLGNNRVLRFTLTTGSTAAPAVTSISPTSGTTAGGTTVTVNGTNLTGATTVSFGGTAGTNINAVNSNQLTVTSPAHAAGLVDVTVTTSGGTSPTSAKDQYIYFAPGGSTIQFSASSYSVGEGDGHIDVTVNRTGDTSSAATIDYATIDGTATQKSDYENALGTLRFAPGETSKTFTVLIVDDKFVEGNETLDLTLPDVSGNNTIIGNPSVATLTIIDNDTASTTVNPYDDARFFVRQHYLDFLNREPDQGGWDFWTNQITSCGNDAACIEVKRINVSAAYFLSNEFQNTGYLAFLTHRSAFGANAGSSPAPVLYNTFIHDVQELGKGYVFTDPNGAQVLETNKVAYFNEFVTRPEFLAKYPASLTNQQFVDNLLTTANLSPDDYIVNLTNAQESPATTPSSAGGQRRDSSYGTAHFTWNPAQTALTITGSVSNIDFTNGQTSDANDDIAGANIAAGASVKPGINGPIVFGFNGTPFNDNNPRDAIFAVSASGIGGTFSTKWDSAEGNGTTLAAQLSNLRLGHAYINFNTNQFPNGEIRGDLPNLVDFRNSLLIGLNQGDETRATVLRLIAQYQFLQTREFNRAFVTMQYFGYLRRDPDTSGFNFWLKKMNDFGGNYINAEMVKAFISATEVRQRFGN